VPALRSLAWRLNWYRQSELEGALLLGRMIRHVSDPYLVGRLTRHSADEARHAWLWARTLERLDLPIVRIRRSYQSFYLDEISAPRGLADVLALTHVFEHRVDLHFTSELTHRDLPVDVRHTMTVLIRDERGHLDWIGRWLAARPESTAIVDAYRRADQRVARRLAPYRERLWDVTGLGEELWEGRRDAGRIDAEESYATQPQHPA
jgi:tRNA isopentenyl-2-thiomethyl-A-37 hydroxylase MiaE